MLRFLNTELQIGHGTQICAAQFHHVYSESSSSFALPFSGKAGTPLGQRGSLKRSARAVQLFGRLAVLETHTL